MLRTGFAPPSPSAPLLVVTKNNMTRLFDIKEGSKISCEVSDGSTYVIFDHLDGMYSYCTIEKGGVLHLAGGTPLSEVEGGYEIAE